MNVFAGSLFVISIGYLYTIVGSLNMAYISQTISSMADRRGLYLVWSCNDICILYEGCTIPTIHMDE